MLLATIVIVFYLLTVAQLSGEEEEHDFFHRQTNATSSNPVHPVQPVQCIEM